MSIEMVQAMYKTEMTAMTRLTSSRGRRPQKPRPLGGCVRVFASQMTTSQARKDFKSTLEKVARGARIILSSHNKPVAAVVPIEDLKLLRAIEDSIDARAAAESRIEAERDGTTTWESIKADLKL